MASDTPIEIDVATVKQWLDSGKDFLFIDCREPSEYATASISGAELMPMSKWPEFAPRLESLRGKEAVVHCHHGGRSLRVAMWLRSNGFPDAQSMAGGIDAWSEQIDPQVPRY